ncbi:MAG: NADPH:quinone reductase-like Zn-dependent oxidoreductase [Planctomycetota bacterium]|jgi:NADPH:quinone reductase-like Zn-dependent oxidoreductase
MPIPDVMNAIVLTGHGGLDKLEYRQKWPTPRPQPDQVLVKVGACGLNNTDINTRTAWYSKSVSEGITEAGGTRGFDQVDSGNGSWGSSAISFPRIQGADVAGTIVGAGDSVDAGRIGERVILDPWILAAGDWLDASRAIYLGSECDGGFAEYTVIRSENAIAIETKLSDAELATYPCAYTTAENLIAKTKLKPGETVAISGASGGVGSAAIQLCRLRGAKVIAIASPAKAVLLEALGADKVIDRNSEKLEQAIMDAANGRIDAAIDVVGGPMFMPLINALRQGGRYSSSGSIAGPLVEFDLRQLVYKDLQLTGATIVPAGTMQRLVKLIEQGQLKPLLAQSFPLADLGKAQQAFLAKKYVGNIVVEI